VKVLPISETDPEALSRVFQQEISCWRQTLFWDYHPTVEIIKRLIASRVLAGWALETQDQGIPGYSYHVFTPPVGYIGNLFVRRESAVPEAYDLLLAHSLRSLAGKQQLLRIEGQVFDFNCDVVPLFRKRGFTSTRRTFLSFPLESYATTELKLPEGFRFIKWSRDLLDQAAEVVYDSYHGSPDRLLCFDYQSREGCMRFLNNLIDHPGCGVFKPRSSYLTLDPTGTVCAVLITSDIRSDSGMVPQISVSRKFQGQGLGSSLLRLYFKEARERGLERITLSVSESNRRAGSLYDRMGFHKHKDFHAFVWEKDQASLHTSILPESEGSPRPNRY